MCLRCIWWHLICFVSKANYLPFLGADLRSDAVLSLGRDDFDGELRSPRDELLELLEYDDPDSDALESDDSKWHCTTNFIIYH